MLDGRFKQVFGATKEKLEELAKDPENIDRLWMTQHSVAHRCHPCLLYTSGCHLSSAKGYLHMAKDAVSIDANTFQFFMRNPRGGRAKEIDPSDVAAYTAYAGDHGITRILPQAPYTLNPAWDKQQTRDCALMVLAEDLGLSLIHI